MENKQDLRVQKTYQALTDTFSEMMGEMPLEEIKINELCNRAQVRRQTFYTHFDGKEDFTQFYLSRVRGEAEAYVGTDIDVFIHSFQETIHNAIQFLQTHERMIHRSAQNSDLTQALEVLTDQVSQSFGGALRDVLHQDALSPEELHMLSVFIAGGTLQVLRCCQMQSDGEADSEMVAQMEDMLGTICRAILTQLDE